MKNQIDSLMQERQLEAVIVVGPGQHNPPMVYLTGGAHLTDAMLVKILNRPPVLFHRTMERDEAAKSGLDCRDLDTYRLEDLVRRFDGDMLRAVRERNRLLLKDLGLEAGRAVVCGKIDAGTALAVYAGDSDETPGPVFAGELGDSILQAAMETKEPAEIERIRSVGLKTTAVIGQAADFLSGHRAKNDLLVKSDGDPLTIGEVKRRMNLWLAERGLENPEGTIFAIGHDAGVPHSTGRDGDPLRLGQTIVLDMFPCEPGGGYFYDITRTWCLGFAPDEAQELYADVLSVFQQVMLELRPGEPCQGYQELACQLFRSKGHPTIQEAPSTTEGYVHSLGHGVGLYLHERPFFRLGSSPKQLLQPDSIVTVEPGLYYPERGLGVRLEDTCWIRPEGGAETLAPYPLDLVLPVRK